MLFTLELLGREEVEIEGKSTTETHIVLNLPFLCAKHLTCVTMC